MRSLYKISLAVLAMAFLIAGSAFAQDAAKPNYSLTGNVGAAFGQFSYDKTSEATTAGANTKAFSEYTTSWETNLTFQWQTDQLTAIGRARIRGNSGGSGAPGNVINGGTNLSAGGQSNNNAFLQAGDDFFTEVWWTPGAFKLGIGKFQGQDWSNPLAGNYIMRNNIGDGEYWLNWTGVSGLDAEYNVGVVQVGVAISNTCVPSCNVQKVNATVPGLTYSTGTTGTPVVASANTEDNTSSITPHLTGKVGDISFRAQLPSTQGTINNHTTAATAVANPLTGSGITDTSTKTVSGSGYQAGVAWAGMPGLRVALDVGGFTEAKVAELQGTASTVKDRARSSYALRLDVPGGPGTINFAYFSIDDNNFGANTYTTTNTTLRYVIPMSFGVIVPEFRSVTNGGAYANASDPTAKNKDATNSEFRLILQGRY